MAAPAKPKRTYAAPRVYPMAAETKICTGVHASSSDQIRLNGFPDVRWTTTASRGQLTAKLATSAAPHATMSRRLQPFNPRSPPIARYVRPAAAAPRVYIPKLKAVLRRAGRGARVRPTDRAAAAAARVAPAGPTDTTAARITANDNESPTASSDSITRSLSATAAVAQNTRIAMTFRRSASR